MIQKIKLLIINNFLNKKFIKYVVVGFSGTSLDFGILYVLVEYAHIWYLLAAILSVAIVLVFSFSLNKYWSFKDFQKNYLLQFAKYVATHLLALGISLGILAFLVEIVHMWYIYAKFFATAVAATVNYLIVNNAIFHKTTK